MRNVCREDLQNWAIDMKCLDYFWKLWQRRYLQSLLERRNMQVRMKSMTLPQPKEGEIVILINTRPRAGRITELIRNSDGKIRSVSLILANNWTTSRTINLIAPLEITDDVDKDERNEFS